MPAAAAWIRKIRIRGSRFEILYGARPGSGRVSPGLARISHQHTTALRPVGLHDLLSSTPAAPSVTHLVSTPVCAASLRNVMLALLRLYAPPPFRSLSVAYIEAIRGTPLLIQLFFIFYGLPHMNRRQWTPAPVQRYFDSDRDGRISSAKLKPHV